MSKRASYLIGRELDGRGRGRGGSLGARRTKVRCTVCEFGTTRVRYRTADTPMLTISQPCPWCGAEVTFA
jgi:hypothetical protein